MTKSNQVPDYRAAITQAEEAVSSMKDLDLRKIAFDRILTTLLGEEICNDKNAHQVVSSNKTPKTIDKSVKSQRGPKAYIEEIIADGFFAQPQPISNVKTELANRGYHVPVTSLSGPLIKLTKERKLRRNKINAGQEGVRGGFSYSIW